MSTINIKYITILIGDGPDHITFDTDLPNPIWPFHGTATIRMDAAAGQGVQFVKDQFPRNSYTVIDRKTGLRRLGGPKEP